MADRRATRATPPRGFPPRGAPPRGPPPRLAEKSPDEFGEGAFVEILVGSEPGSFGTVVKVTGAGVKRRWKIQIEGKDHTTWAEAVKLAEKDASSRKRVTVSKAERKAHYAALRPADIGSVAWPQAKELWALDGGSGGVMLVDLGEECIAIKPQGPTATSDLMALFVAECVGVPVAKMRIVKSGHGDYDEMMEHLKRCVKAHDGSEMAILGVSSRSGQVTGAGKQCYGVLEYVPGVTMMGEDAQKVMASPPASLLVALGRLCALDVLLNNMDRVPLPVWQNDGNMGNVMIAGEGTTIIGIDQQINQIRTGSYRDAYVRKVQELVGDVCPTGDQTDIIANLTQVMATNVRLTLGKAETDSIVQGIREGFVAIAEAASDGSLEQSLEAAAAACAEAFADPAWESHALYDEKAVADMKDFVLAIGAGIASVPDLVACPGA